MTLSSLLMLVCLVTITFLNSFTDKILEDKGGGTQITVPTKSTYTASWQTRKNKTMKKMAPGVTSSESP